MSQLSVILPTHNPDGARLRRVLDGLRAQTLPAARWETILVDNASTLPVSVDGNGTPANLHIVREPQLGLTAARRRGLTEARGEFIVMVDDDNVLAPDYCAQVIALFAAHARIGALGGKSLPEFEQTPPAWVREFDDLLACRDYGDKPQISNGLRDARQQRNEYPHCAPIGAGMALRRSAVQPWLDDALANHLTDRRGSELTSGGDNDIVLSLMEHGWEVGYFPSLSLTHLVPAGRTTREYLACLSRAIGKSWIQVLTKHTACPWEPIPRWTVRPRQFKAWFTYRAWAGPAEYIRWQGACGHFEGRASIRRAT